MTALTYPDNARLEHTTKEAVASAILHQTYNALRGAGPGGQIIYREKPAKVLHTQFLLPRRKASSTATTYHEREDISSPAHISTLGMGFQIADRRDRTIAVSIRACIYVRILPSTVDLVTRPVVFRLSKQARSVILRHRREALSKAREANKELLEQEGPQSAAWLEIKNGTVQAAEMRALEELGVAPTSLSELKTQESVVSILPERDEAPGGDDPTVREETAATETTADDVVADAGDVSGAALENERAPASREGTAIGDSDTLKVFEFIVAPGATRAPPEVLTEREQIPQKWLRLPVDLGTLQIDLSSDAASIDKAVADFNEEMRRRIEAELDKWEADSNPDTGGILWGFPEGAGVRSRMITPGEVVGWEQTLGTLRSGRKVARPTIEPVLEFENLEDPLHPNERTIRILLANESSLAEHDTAEAREQDASLYQAEVAVSLSSDLHCPITLERVAPSYRYNTYLQHDALGINCGVRRRRLVDANVLETTALPVYFQPLIKQFEIDPAPEFERLSEKDGGLPILRSLLKAYDDWLKEVVDSKPYEKGLDPARNASDYQREKQQFESVDLRRWREERRSIERGVTILEQAFEARMTGKEPDSAEAMPLTAWRFMNQAFGKFWSRKNSNVKQWRLFQLAFIVSQIPAIVSRLDHWKDNPTAFREEDDREATLLYFSTGGGKSESFFGLLVYALAFDRLRGKSRGITAAVRYPLRLLTSQQANRLAQVLAAAQRVRWEWKDAGFDLRGQGFEIGFWVGGNNTPNNQNARGVSEIPKLHKGWDELPHRRGDYAIYLKKWSRLPSCPFCNGTLQGEDGKKRSTIGLRRLADGLEERLAHLCFNRKCDWNGRHGAIDAPHPLPIHIMDTDIYAHTPCVLLGTVDKLALIGQSARTIARVLGMFGYPAWHHKASGRLYSPNTREQFRKGPQAMSCEPVFPFYDNGAKLFLDPYPLLEIQDEAHLLDESLGTFSGLFETTFQHALRLLAPLHGDRIASAHGKMRLPRIVAASATVTDPTRQIDQIYQRSAVLFPQPGPDLYESFYARLNPPLSGDPTRNGSANGEHRTPTRRRYVSLLTNGRTHTAATVAVLSRFHLTISQLMKGLIEGDDASRWKMRQEMADALPDDIFNAGHRAALLDPKVDHSEIAGIINLDRIALLYVTNKKGGDNVKAALQDVVRRDHRLADFGEMPGVKTELITGAIDAGLIGAIVTEAASVPPLGTPMTMEQLRDSLRSVIATSAISHGVDVDEFNMMFFAGQPADIAEYIQASSRVGRTHVGTSVLIPTPQQRRDRYIVEIHDIFHRFLERMIDAAPVERWAENAINRTLASFLQLKICGVDYIRAMHAAKTPADKAALAEPDSVAEIGDRSRRDHINLLDELRKFVTDGIGLFHATSPINKKFYEQHIHDLFNDATQQMEQANWRTEKLESFFRQPASPLSRPMTSLRDVNEAGLIEGGLGAGTDRINRADLGKVMSALMRGNNSWTAGEAGE
jgi:hypothetical protein